ncbi:MAG: site-specific integrase [Bacteroidetes bacterium]|nr:site-specific integrase [Bacteroidota bacterium]
MNTYSIILRKDRTDTSGVAPLVFISTNKKQVKREIGFRVNPGDWNPDTCLLKPSPQNSLINLKLAQIKSKADSLILKLALEGKELDPIEFYNHVFEDTNREIGSDFFEFFEFYLKIKDYPTKHWESYITLRDQLKAFKPNATFEQMDYTFAVSFVSFLKTKYGNSPNTQQKKVELLRCIFKEAVKHKKVKENPFLEVKIKTTPTDRMALTIQEVEKLEQLYDSGVLTKNQQSVLQSFLLSCFTGLRYSDLLQFSVFHIKRNVIKLKQIKTGGVVSIPLIDRARKYLPTVRFEMLSNQKTNTNLKKIITEHTNITGNVTCHVGRHTFATIGLNSGIPLEVVSELLGHSSIKVTKRYAKMLDKFKELEMQKWGNVGQKPSQIVAA